MIDIAKLVIGKAKLVIFGLAMPSTSYRHSKTSDGNRKTCDIRHRQLATSDRHRKTEGHGKTSDIRHMKSVNQ